VAPALPLAQVLVQELSVFKVKITESLHETYESWRSRDHDDLVLAVALACWGAETFFANDVWNPSPPERCHWHR
jgi:hypothetical protein